MIQKSQKKGLPVRNTQTGFTLIETLVAIAILLIGIVAPISIIYNSHKTTELSQAKTFAYYMAIEGVEYVRHVRDTNIINNAPSWLDSLDRCTNPSIGCDLKDPTNSVTNSNDFEKCTGLPKCLIKHNTTSKLYSTSESEDTIFERVITVVPAGGTGEEVLVTVTLTWTIRGTIHAYKLEHHMFNWSGLP